MGEGEIVVRRDAETGQESTAGLNRDVREAYEITKDEEERTDLYVSDRSVDAVAAAATRISREIQAQRVSADQVPESAKRQLGEERALAMAKNLARHGLSPELMENLSPETVQRLASWADRAENYNKVDGSTGGSGGASSSGGQATDGVIDLGSTTVVGGPRTSGEALLLETSRFQEYLGTLPLEEAQLTILGMQALMGPAKAAVSLAGNALLNSLFGDKIDALKESAAVGMTAGLSDREGADVQEDHDYAKKEHAAGNEYYPLDGDGYVLASRFLIDLVAGEIGSLAGKAVGRTIGIVPGAKGGTSSADKVSEGEVGTYGSTAPRSVGDGLTPDHIPSFAAVKEALRQLGVELTDVELKALRNNTNCVVVKTCSHLTDSRTFGGRNNPEKIKLDGADLYKAAEADIDTWVPVWKSEGWSASKIDKTRREVHELNKKLFDEMGIKYESQ